MFLQPSKGNEMIKRWDNSPHWKERKTFFYHVQMGDEAEPKESPVVFIEDILHEIERIRVKNFE
ncbi:MAG: toxin-antitoxin system TumE family protein [Methanosarcina sp.]